jgi:hypothetical protein
MKIPSARFTGRRLMVAVAITALILVAARLLSTSRQRTATATHHAEYERMALWIASTGDSWIGPASKFRRLASYHATMKLKYRVAARYPWLPVASDPPEPK